MSCLVIAATAFELQAYVRAGGDLDTTLQLVSGIGPVETAVNLSAMLHNHRDTLSCVLNFGIAGAYPDNNTSNTADLLDVCLAQEEILGDLGICLEDSFERFVSPELAVDTVFPVDSKCLAVALSSLQGVGIVPKTGPFITVNCASGTKKRGRLLGREFQAICENMEGAAVARTCQQFTLPWIEVRCISNFVVDRDLSGWQINKACALAGRAAAEIVHGIHGALS